MMQYMTENVIEGVIWQKKNNIKMAQLAMELSGLFSWLDSEHFVTLADGGSQSEQPNYV